MQFRKTMSIRNSTDSDELGVPCAQLIRVALLAVLRNPFAGVAQADLTKVFEHRAKLGGQLAAEAVSALGASPVGYGKAAIAGADWAAVENNTRHCDEAFQQEPIRLFALI